MPYALTCPSCKKVLRVSDGVKIPSLTCPRCLMAIQNPAWKQAISAKVPTAEMQGAPTLSMICPECEKPIQPDWVQCSHCGASLAEPEKPQILMSRRKRSLVEDDVRKDTHSLGIGVIVLAVLGGIGLVQVLAVAGSASIHEKDSRPLLSALVGFAIPAMIGVGLVFTRHKPEDIGVGRVMLGALAAIGISFLLVLSLAIFVFAVCVAAIVGSRVR